MPPPPPRPALTHFVCLPLATPASTPHLSASLSRFGSSYSYPSPPAQSSSNAAAAAASFQSGDPGSPSPPPSLPLAPFPQKSLRPVGTLHLTLGVMSLLTPERVEAALGVLRGLDVKGMLAAGTNAVATHAAAEEGGVEIAPQVLLTQPLVVSLRGLMPMQSPEKTSVLYATPLDASGRLMGFCEAVRKEFVKEGLVIEEARDRAGLKLHATVVNTVYAKERGKRGGRGRGKGGRGGGRDDGKFDATELIEKWKDEVWAEVKVEKVAVCEMGAKAGEDGEVRYVEIGEVEMP